MTKTGVFLFAFYCGIFSVAAQVPQNGLDVQHYRYEVALNDSTNMISCTAAITVQFTKEVQEVVFDLTQQDDAGRGMAVRSVMKNGNVLHFTHQAAQLVIRDGGTTGTVTTYTISYSGMPADGLIIAKNKYGDRTFFTDHWPNRAHNWLPCNDHLSDKATVEFIVTAPEQYSVISNGIQLEVTNLPDHLKRTHWKESVPIATKVMAMGAARFAIGYAGNFDCIPVSSWVYPQDRDTGFAGYAAARPVLAFFNNLIGPYAFSKLANVQSKTMFGGMENASCIFYNEPSVRTPDLEGLIAHEIAHQWFGNMATETDWPHLWLSEGFATYMTHIYHEANYGKDSLKRRMQQDRETVTRFFHDKPMAVVDTLSGIKPLDLLNANSYQKGGWVLHMLRRTIGDSAFRNAYRTYYATYAGRNASTNDFRKIAERESGMDLTGFFQQWLFKPGHPILKIGWKYDKKQQAVAVTVDQVQDQRFDVTFEFALQKGIQSVNASVQLQQKRTVLVVPVTFVPEVLIADPDTNLLFEADIQHRR